MARQRRPLQAQKVSITLRYHPITGAKMPETLPENPPVAAKTLRLSAARRTAILKALADPRRFELLERIAKAGCPLGCAQARAALPISAATLSHHIKELETAGLIHVRREGKFHFLTLRPGVLQGIVAILQSLGAEPCPAR
jgi:ArsR family transcriptional regulator, arsenate/arsenite/antimonite-responsive transcriptional repressor